MKTGKLLNQIIEMDRPMGIAYERAIGFEKDMHTHGRHMVVCTRGSSTMDIRLKDSGKVISLDSTRILWLPKGMAHDDLGTSAIYDTMALYPSEDYFEAMIKDNGLSADDGNLLCEQALLFKRTKWLDDILNRYFFERVLNSLSPVGCTFFLEKQIMNEMARIMFQDKLLQIWGEKNLEGTGTDAFDRALRYIESNIFNAITLEQISEAAKISESTLLRRFKENVQKTPYEYIKGRRLEEAKHLLKLGEHPVGDVALLVGYEDFSAFSKAFRIKFKQPPTFFSNYKA